MKAYKIFESGEPRLRLVELPELKAGPGKVVVRVRATSLNYRDLMVLTGRYGEMRLPIVPLSDGAGDIVAIGEGVTRWKPGDRVAGLFFQGWHTGTFQREMGHTALGGELDGMLAESVALAEDGVIPIPPHMSFAEAATLPCAGLTAWHALVTVGNVSADETVLLLGTGGVSIFALQFAKMHGARVIITSGSDEKLARARALGADETINYHSTPDWEKEVYRLTNKAGADHVIEVGGQNTLGKSLASLAIGGQIHIIGGVSGFTSEVSLGAILGRSAVIRGIRVGSSEMFEAMNRAMILHRTQPVVDKVFDFHDTPAAYQYLQSGKHFGKVVISI
ncbi:MAG TPA: NAD(P)-dependent alcohol dehydrogenase [Candidatus Sulfotelmatobacter sp.]|nr:NAD(P)-dependent alcohol dehydrogenase [Candidatus Sulfotelmatobacter sp.]